MHALGWARGHRDALSFGHIARTVENIQLLRVFVFAGGVHVSMTVNVRPNVAP